MNIKSFLGAILSLLGILSILYAVMLYTSGSVTGMNTTLIIYGILGVVLLVSGFGLNESVTED